MDEVKHLGVFFLNKIIIFTCYHRWLKKNSYTDDRTTDPKIKNWSCVNLAFLKSCVARVGSVRPRPCKNTLYFRYVLSNLIGLFSTFSTFGVF
jgi:hypothetical protein